LRRRLNHSALPSNLNLQPSPDVASFSRCPQTRLRLSPRIYLSALRADTTSDFLRLLVPSALPSDSSSACASDQSSGLPADFSVPGSIGGLVPMALPSSQPPTRVDGQPFGPACKPNLQLPGPCVLQRCHPANPRLASPVNLPASSPNGFQLSPSAGLRTAFRSGPSAFASG